MLPLPAAVVGRRAVTKPRPVTSRRAEPVRPTIQQPYVEQQSTIEASRSAQAALSKRLAASHAKQAEVSERFSQLERTMSNNLAATTSEMQSELAAEKNRTRREKAAMRNSIADLRRDV